MIDFDTLVLGPCLSAFGQITLYTAPGQSFDLPGIFDRYHAEITFDAGGVPVSTQRPMLGVRESDFPFGLLPAQGDTVLIDGTVYLVTDTQPDGHGHILLPLKLAR